MTYAPSPRPGTSILAALATGGLYFATFPPLDIGPLAFVALVPLLAVCVHQTRRAAFATGWAAGTIGIHALVTPSILEAASRYAPASPAVAWLLAVVIPQAYGALYFGAFALLARCLAEPGVWPVAAVVLQAAAFVACEVVRSHLGDGCPWVLLGHSQYRNLPLIQVADLGGVPAVSFVVALVNTSLAAQCRRDWPARTRGAAAALAACVVGATWGYGILQVRRWEQPPGPSMRVALIQSDVPIAWRYSLPRQPETLRRLAELTARAVEKQPRLIVWPENAVSVLVGEQSNITRRAAAVLPPGTALLLGAPRAVQRGARVELRNAALVLDADGRITGIYDKLRLTPFGETYPFGVSTWLAPPAGGYAPGDAWVVLEAAGTRFAAVICYEAVYPGLVRRLVEGGAEFIVNISNDEWFGEQPSLAQHFHAALFRAVENRRFLLRATTAGITAIVDARGAIVAEAPRGVPFVLEGALTPIAARTVYGLVGETVGWSCAVLVALALLATHCRGRASRGRAGGRTGPRAGSSR